MFAKRWITALATTMLGATTNAAMAAAPSAATSSVTATFAQTYTGCYMTGQPKRHVTIAPGGAETLASAGITIDVVVRDAAGNPCVGIPASDIYVDHPNVTWCAGGNTADAPTDANGFTSFSGYLCGGGCADQLTVYVGNLALGVVDVAINSPDFAHLGTSPGFIDAADLAFFASVFPASTCGAGFGTYSICYDFNEDGSVDASDWAFFAAYFARSCNMANGCP